MNNIAYLVGGVLIVLKALGCISLSWWWCTFPFWIEIASVIILAIGINVTYVLRDIINSIFKN